MALTGSATFLYNLEVTPLNQFVDFVNVSAGMQLTATLNTGFYSLTSLLSELVRAITVVDPNNLYTATADRTIAGGLQNRVTIATSGAYLDLLFSSGTHSAASVGPLLGFAPVDQTGDTSYTGISTSGTLLITTYPAYNYTQPEFLSKIFGNVNVSAIGQKEAIVFQIQSFWEAEFKYEPKAYVLSDWIPFIQWAIQQRLFDFTPELSNPTVFYEGTLETSSEDGKGLGFKMKEMLPEFPNFYTTQPMRFRQNIVNSQFAP